MLKRIVEISESRTYLSVRLGQLRVERREGEQREISSIPCEDIGLLIVDHAGTVYSHSVLTELMRCGAGVVICGGDHHPAGLLLPMVGHCEQTERVRKQIAAKEPVKKQLWQQIVQSKIRHQAKVLGPENNEYGILRQMAERVRSGDAGNMEAQASRIYWPAYFGDLSVRRYREGPPPNNLLNYGYVVLRAAVARALVGTGLLTSLGIHHRSKYNAFCLADDVLEPFRGLVEAKVRKIWDQEGPEGCEELTQAIKARLLEILYEPLVIAGQKGPLMVGLHRTAASVYKCLAGDCKKLALPEL